MILLLAALAAAATTPPQAQAVPAPSAVPAATAPAAAAQDLRLRGAALRFFAGETGRAPYLDPAERALLAPVIEQPDWRLLLLGATQFARERGAEGDTLWWSPSADAGIAIHWRRGADGWRAVALRPYVGRGGDPASAARAAQAALDAAPVPASAAEAQRRGMAALVSLRHASPERLLAGEGLLIRARLPQDGPDAALGRWLATMPPQARLGLSPVARRAEAGGEAIWWQSNAAPDALLVLHYPADAAVLMPASIDIINLATAGDPR